MQNQIRTALSTNNRHFLPTWMTSKQPNGKVLNYVPAVPLIYAQPGTGRRMLYLLQQATYPPTAINTELIEGLADRYYWDDGLALNWDKNTNAFIPDNYTSFDKIVTSNTFNMLGSGCFIEEKFCQRGHLTMVWI
jgi:hypothetical protein